jgi:hypothetical protein
VLTFCESQPPTQERCTPPSCMGASYQKRHGLPVWAILLIILTCVAAAGGLAFAGLIIYRRCACIFLLSLSLSFFFTTTSASNLSSLFYPKYHLPVSNTEMLTLCLCQCADETTAATMVLCMSCWIATDLDCNRTLSLSVPFCILL